MAKTDLSTVVLAFIFLYLIMNSGLVQAPPGSNHTSYTLTLSTTTGGTTIPAPGAHTYPSGTRVDLTATASTGYIFDHWIVNGATGVTTPNTYVTMNQDKVVTATFQPTQNTDTSYTIRDTGIAYAALQGSATIYTNQDFATLLNTVLAAASPTQEIHIEAGTYPVTQPITSTKGFTLKGAGIDQTNLRATGSFDIILMEPPTIQTVHISDLTLDGNRGLTGQLLYGGGARLTSVNAYLTRVKAVNTWGTGILFFVDQISISHVEAVDCQTTNTGSNGFGPGIRLDHRPGSAALIGSALIRGCTITGGAEHGIKAYDSTVSPILIQGNHVTGVSGTGIWCEGEGTVENNQVSNIGNYGIVLDHAQIICRNNQVTNTGTTNTYAGGIYINNLADSSTISGNTITQSRDAGIQIMADNCQISGNTITQSGNIDIRNLGTGNTIS